MKKIKFAVLLSLVFVFIGGFVKAQTVDFLYVTRTDEGTSAGESFTITINAQNPINGNPISDGSNSFTNGQTKTYSTVGYSKTFTVKRNSTGEVSTAYLLPAWNGNGQVVIFSYATYAIVVTLYGNSVNNYSFTASLAPPVG